QRPASMLAHRRGSRPLNAQPQIAVSHEAALLNVARTVQKLLTEGGRRNVCASAIDDARVRDSVRRRGVATGRSGRRAARLAGCWCDVWDTWGNVSFGCSV